MNMNDNEISIINRLQNTDDPFEISDKDLDLLVTAIKRERGSAEMQLRRVIRHNVARAEKWAFALDGGFMTNRSGSAKEWPDARTSFPFAKVYSRYERLALYVHLEHGISLVDIEAIATSPIDKDADT